jgi:hypothetical protein
MYTAEFDTFRQTLTDLCVAVNRPVNDALVRVFWEDLREYSLTQIQERCRNLRRDGVTKFTSAHLRPESKPTGTYEPVQSDLDHFDRFGNIQFWKFLRTHDTTPEQLQALLARKQEIISAARHDPEMQLSDDEGQQREQGKQLHEILFAAWEKVIEQ